VPRASTFTPLPAPGLPPSTTGGAAPAWADWWPWTWRLPLAATLSQSPTSEGAPAVSTPT